MASKQFKIGEYAVGGIIQVDISQTTIHINALDYNTKNLVTGYVYPNYDNPYWDMVNDLNELTSSYYADIILEYIVQNSNIERQSFK